MKTGKKKTTKAPDDGTEPYVDLTRRSPLPREWIALLQEGFRPPTRKRTIVGYSLTFKSGRAGRIHGPGTFNFHTYAEMMEFLRGEPRNAPFDIFDFIDVIEVEVDAKGYPVKARSPESRRATGSKRRARGTRVGRSR
jgi:hypothetical protein